jgi:hypothetical protein
MRLRLRIVGSCRGQLPGLAITIIIFSLEVYLA